MPAVRPHSTEVVDRPWDEALHRRRLREDQDPAYYRQAHAWLDPEANPRTKAAWKFIHHMVSEDGEIGAANLTACRAGIAILNGARGVDVARAAWAEDREAIYRHLARHIEDAGEDPPELRPLSELQRAADDYELRAVAAALELRQEEGSERVVLTGYAALFNEPSLILEGIRFRFQEVILPGAFRDSLDGDVRALWQHSDMYVLGRTTNGTLRLEEDERGLRFELEPPPTQWARDAVISIKRGDVTQMSFGFRVPEGGDEWDNGPDGIPLRKLKRVELLEISPVTFPAYPKTSVAVRNRMRALQEERPIPVDDESRARLELEYLERRVKLINLMVP